MKRLRGRVLLCLQSPRFLSGGMSQLHTKLSCILSCEVTLSAHVLDISSEFNVFHSCLVSLQANQVLDGRFETSVFLLIRDTCSLSSVQIKNTERSVPFK